MTELSLFTADVTLHIYFPVCSISVNDNTIINPGEGVR